MIIKEYRLVLPLSVEEYQIGQLWSVAEASKQETGGGEGVEVLENRPFDGVPLYNGIYTSGQYTHKIYHLQSKIPPWIRKIIPKGATLIHEKAWNAYPYCKTELTNPDYMGDDFYVKIETIHLDDRGTTENAHSLNSQLLAKREVVNINIANDHEFLNSADIRPETSPSTFLSKKTGRGQLTGQWRQTCQPSMCAYKLVTFHFKWFGFQNLVETFGHKQYPRLFSKFHREVFCWIDEWYGLTMIDIRRIEELVQMELNEEEMCDIDVGEAYGGMELEWLEEKLIDFGCSLEESSANEILRNLNALGTVRNLKNDDLIDGLIAHLLNLKKTNVTLEFIEDYETQLTTKPKPKQCSNNASTSAYNALQRSILRELPVSNTVDFDDNNDLDPCFPDDDFKNMDIKRDSVLGNVKLSYRGKSFSTETDAGTSSTCLPSLRLLCDCTAGAYSYGNSNIMFDMNEIFDDENDAEAVNIKEEVDEKDNVEVTSFISGMIMPDEGRILNLQNAVIYSNSRIVPLDLEKLEQFSLFPGKKVKLKGSFINNVFQCQEIIEAPPLRLAKLGRNSDFDYLKVCIACGPFSCSEDLCVSNSFMNLLSHAARANVNALILVGPFISKNCTLKPSESTEDLFNAYLQTISKFISTKKLSLRVFILPSAVSDVNAMPYFPTPPYETSNIIIHENITLLPDPAIFELEGVRFAVSASEVIMHLSKREVYKSANAENEDRMQRLFSHILSSHSLYPLYPSDSSLPFSLKDSQRKVELLEKPHVLILPSILQPIIKIVDNCVTCNPGKFIRGKSGGTFAMLNVDLKSAISDSIAPFSSLSLLSNVIS